MRLTQETEFLLKDMASSGVTVKEASEKTGLSVNKVRGFSKQHGLKFKRPSRKTPEFIDRDSRLCEMFKTGVTLQECGDAFGLTRERVRQILNTNGISERYQWTAINSGRLNGLVELYIAGEGRDVLAETFNISRGSITRYLTLTGIPEKYSSKRRIACFWRSVNVTANPDQCWEWMGCKCPSGYGHTSWQGKATSSHRVAFELHFHRRPKQWVLHTCDNRLCVNPNHLYEGTPSDNAQDRDSRGRGAHQTGKIFKRLNPVEVVRIKQLLGRGVTQNKIAEAFDVNIATVNKINTGKSHHSERTRKAFNEHQLVMVRRDIATGKPMRSIAKDYGVSCQTILRIKKGHAPYHQNFL